MWSGLELGADPGVVDLQGGVPNPTAGIPWMKDTGRETSLHEVRITRRPRKPRSLFVVTPRIAAV